MDTVSQDKRLRIIAMRMISFFIVKVSMPPSSKIFSSTAESEQYKHLAQNFNIIFSAAKSFKIASF